MLFFFLFFFFFFGFDVVLPQPEFLDSGPDFRQFAIVVPDALGGQFGLGQVCGVEIFFE
jgi:hypothetical protein